MDVDDRIKSSDPMDSKTTNDLTIKEEADSGVDNTSESSHSGDEDHLALHSDDDLVSSDNEANPNKEELGSPRNKESLPERTMEGDLWIKMDSMKRKNSLGGLSDVRIELNNTKNIIREEYKEVVEFFEDLAKSQCETADFSITSDTKKPEWFDEEKFKRGQKFARDHLFCTFFAEMISLFVLFAHKASLGPLIFTGKSDSPFAAFKRYLNTLTKIKSWYEDDFWNEKDSMGAKNLATVRGMHKNVYQKLTNSSAEDLEKKTTLGDPNTTAIWCPMKDLIVEDFRESIPCPPKELEELEQHFSSKKVWVNQADMSMTQFGFVGLVVTYPKTFGIYFASDEDLDAFLHLWRCLGYLLGIKDKYNFCNTSLEAVRLRTKFYLEVVAKPSFRNVTYDWEHMCRCVTAGISYYLPVVNFDSSLLFLCNILNIKTPRLKKEMSFGCYILFLMHRLTFYLMKFRGVLQYLNSNLYDLIRKVQNAPPDLLTKWEKREFSYTKQPGKCPVRGYSMSTNV